MLYYRHRKKERKNMKKINQKAEQVSAPEQVSKLQTFPFIAGEDYLLKLENGD